MRPILAIGLLLATLSACSASSSSTPVREIESGAAAPLARADHVVLLIIDGLRPDAITPSGSPHLDGMREASASSPEARTVLPTLTLPAHTSHVSGLRPEEHGVEWNTWRPGTGRIEVETVFDVARSAGLRTGLQGGKYKLRHLADPGEIDCMTVEGRDDAEVMETALACIRETTPHLMLIHLPEVDRAGHASGWMSNGQREQVLATDALVGKLLAEIETRRPGETWAVIVSADHGGEGRNHGAGRPIDRAIPWFVWGDGVTAGRLGPVSATASARTALQALALPVPRRMGPSPTFN